MIGEVRKVCPAGHVLILTMRMKSGHVRVTLDAGASGVCRQECGGHEIIDGDSDRHSGEGVCSLDGEAAGSSGRFEESGVQEPS